MAVHVIRKGLDLPITGAPVQEIDQAQQVSRVAVMAHDYPFMKPRMKVEVGETVRRGQLLLEDRKTEGVRFTAPGAGRVAAINRGDRRALQSVVIELSGNEQRGEPSADELQPFVSFPADGAAEPTQLEPAVLRDLLVESGLWTALRRRPFSTVPAPAEQCRSVFVTAIDSNPLTASPEVVMAGRMDDLHRGLAALTRLASGTVWLCCKAGSDIDAGQVPGVKVEQFAGPHPAGLAGTHIHLLDPVSADHSVWYIGYQDVLAIGHLLQTGTLDCERVVALGGPPLARPRLLRTRLGAFLDELLDGELPGSDPTGRDQRGNDLPDRELRVISGSVLHGHKAMGPVWGYLGRYTNQVSVLLEDRSRRFLRWLRPGADTYSSIRAYLAWWIGRRSFALTTAARGSSRAMVPIGLYERVMPLDIMPTFLLRALISQDLERAEALGCLELDEEDLALCTFVSAGKEDFGLSLRQALSVIWKEG